MHRSLITAAIVAGGVVVVPPLAHAGDTTCVGTLTGVHDNVVVPPGAACVLAGTEVTGNVKVERDATLRALGARIRGNVQGDGVASIELRFQTSVGGDFHMKGGAAGAPSEFTGGVTIGGDVLVEGNAGDTIIRDADVTGDIDVLKNFGFVRVEINTVGGDVSVAANSGGLSVFRNRVAGNMKVEKSAGAVFTKQVVANVVVANLQCVDNDQTFVGGPNTAGKAEGQCF